MFLIIRLFAIYDKRKWILYVTVPFGLLNYCPIKCTLVYRHQLFFLLNVSFFFYQLAIWSATLGVFEVVFFWSIRVRGYYVSALSTPFRLLLTYSNKRRGGFADSGPDCFAQPNFDTNGESRSHGGSKLTALETRIAIFYYLTFIYLHYYLRRLYLPSGRWQDGKNVSRKGIIHVSLIDSVNPPSRRCVYALSC